MTDNAAEKTRRRQNHKADQSQNHHDHQGGDEINGQENLNESAREVGQSLQTASRMGGKG